MTSHLSQRIRCAVYGHDWRRAIGPRDGFYLRCRRCSADRPLEETGSVAGSPTASAGGGPTHPHA